MGCVRDGDARGSLLRCDDAGARSAFLECPPRFSAIRLREHAALLYARSIRAGSRTERDCCVHRSRLRAVCLGWSRVREIPVTGRVAPAAGSARGWVPAAAEPAEGSKTPTVEPGAAPRLPAVTAAAAEAPVVAEPA